MSDLPRGIRNNNPGNIRLQTGVEWVGQVPGDDPSFVTFSDAKYGIRAIAEILKAYWSRDGVDTIGGAIRRWAPPTENNTGAYIDDVARRAKFDADTPTALDPVLRPLIEAIIAHENSNYAYPEGVLYDGLLLAHLGGEALA